MDGRVSVSSHCGKMLRCSVALVTVKPISRILLVKLLHPTIAHDLRHDRGRCDCSAPSVSTDDTTLRDKQARYPERVNESKVGQGMECDQRRVVNIESVDVRRFPHSHRPAKATFEDLVVQPVPYGWSEQLGVAEPPHSIVWRQDDRRSHDRPSKTATPDLVDAGDAYEPGAAQLVLDSSSGGRPTSARQPSSLHAMGRGNASDYWAVGRRFSRRRAAFPRSFRRK